MMRRVALLVTAVAYAAKASDLTERQNPSFVSVLPTKATESPVVIVTTTATATPVLQTTTIAAAPRPPQTTLSTNTQPPPLRPSDGVPSSSPTAANDNAGPSTTVDSALVGPYFGGVPSNNPDIPIISVFLNLFLLGAIVNAVFYRLNARASKRSPRDMISGLMVVFCLARMIACALRLAWIAASTSPAVIFLAMVSDNAG